MPARLPRCCFALVLSAAATPAWSQESLLQPSPEAFVRPLAIIQDQPPATPRQQQPDVMPPTVIESPRTSAGNTTFGPANPFAGAGSGNAISWSSDAIRSDSDRVGSYNQPAWTTQRPYSAVRTYVLPEGQMQIEQWYRPRWKKDGSREDRILEELAIGLPHRFQLDIYGRWNIEENDNGHYRANWEGTMIEMRYALANWGELPLNPTLYAEWVQRGNREGEPDKYELKFLLAEELWGGKLFWAANAILEQEVGGEKATEWGISQALSTTIIERKLMAGVEMWYRTESVHGDRGNPSHELLIGPTLQWRPTTRMFVNVSPLFGVTHDAPKVEMFIVVGFQFGARAGPSFGGMTPSSLGQ